MPGREAISTRHMLIFAASAASLSLWPDLLEVRRRLDHRMVLLVHGSGTSLIRVVPTLEVAQRCHRFSDVVVL